MKITFAKTKVALLGGLLAGQCLYSQAGPTGIEYEYVGGGAGFGGQLFLDASSGTGGSLSDILSGSITTPFWGTIALEANRVYSFSPLSWNSAAITAMNIEWSVAIAGNSPSGLLASTGVSGGVSYVHAYYSGMAPLPPGNNQFNNAGHWVSVPDAAGTAGMFLIGLAGLGAAQQLRRRTTTA